MPFLRSTRVLIGALLAVIPASGRTFSQEANAQSAADLAQKVQADKTVLNYDDNYGYLRSVLKQLQIPVSSQPVVFSKSSFQLSQISPHSIRAVYIIHYTSLGLL